MKRRCVEGYNGVVWFYNHIVVSIELKKKLGLNGVRAWCGSSKGADMRFDWRSKNKELCELCADRLREEEKELKEDREITKTEEIFGSEEAYWSYKVGNYN